MTESPDITVAIPGDEFTDHEIEALAAMLVDLAEKVEPI